MTLTDIRREAKTYGLEVEETATEYVIKLKGQELKRVPKTISLAQLTDTLADCAR